MNIKIIATIIIIAVLLGGAGWMLWQSQHAKFVKLQAFAQCINESGAKFYGAFWCPHCQTQKAMFNTLFENADKLLPYVECSTPNSQGQLQVCKDENIEVYPTWKFPAEGGQMSVHEGELTFQQLAEKTGCQQP